MEHITEYVALVEFAGAFNFLFCADYFHKHFSEHIINISKKQKSNFDNIRNKMSADIMTIESHDPIGQPGKSSNEHELIDITSQYNLSRAAINQVGDKLKKKIENIKQPAFSREMFLLMGLYSLFAIFFICKIGHLQAKDIPCEDWCNAFCSFAFITIIWWLYFVISEVVWLFRKSRTPNPFIFSPSFTWTIFLFLAATCIILFQVANCPDIPIDNDTKVYLVAFLPLLAFITAIFLFIITNASVWIRIIFETIVFKIQLWLLARKKKNVLSPYKHLKESAITIS